MNLRFKPGRRLLEIQGAGDAVALVAQPIKRAIRLIKPDFLKDCNCEARREFLNRLFEKPPTP